MLIAEQSNVKLTGIKFQRVSFRRNSRFSVKRVSEEPADGWDETHDGEVYPALADFRDGGKRYLFSEERRNHFEIKYW